MFVGVKGLILKQLELVFQVLFAPCRKSFWQRGLMHSNIFRGLTHVHTYHLLHINTRLTDVCYRSDGLDCSVAHYDKEENNKANTELEHIEARNKGIKDIKRFEAKCNASSAKHDLCGTFVHEQLN